MLTTNSDSNTISAVSTSPSPTLDGSNNHNNNNNGNHNVNVNGDNNKVTINAALPQVATASGLVVVTVAFLSAFLVGPFTFTHKIISDPNTPPSFRLLLLRTFNAALDNLTVHLGLFLTYVFELRVGIWDANLGCCVRAPALALGLLRDHTPGQIFNPLCFETLYGCGTEFAWVGGLYLRLYETRSLEHSPVKGRRRIGTKPILNIEVNEEGKLSNTKSSP